MYAAIVVRKKPGNGKQVDYYINTQQYINGVRKCSTISVRKYLGLDRPAKKPEAKQLLSKIIEDNRRGLFIKGSRKHLRVYMGEWLKHHSLTVKKSTASSYDQVIDAYIVPILGDIPLVEITVQQIKEWHSALLSQVSNTTTRYAHTILKSALNTAVKEGLLLQNVAKLVKPPAQAKKPISWLEWEEVERLLEVTKEDRYGIYFRIALSTGMGRSEILGLRWQDVDFKNNTISIKQTYVRTKEGSYFQDSAKTANRLRTVDVGNKLLTHLNEWQQQQEFEKEALGYNSNLVITTQTGQPVNPSNLQRYITRIIKNHGLPHFSTHTLRHSHATKLLMEGMPPKAVAERLGHSVKILLDTYAHVSPRIAREAAAITDL